MRQFLQDVRFGTRTLAKTPGFTAVAIVVLAIGIGANTAMFALVNALLIKPLAGQADELVGLYSHDRNKVESYRAFAYENYVEIRNGNDVFDALMAHTFSMVGVPAGDTTRQTFIEVVSSNYFDALGVPLVAGRPFTLEEERPSARVPVAPGPIVAQLSDRIEVLTLLRALRKNTQSFLTTRRGGFRE